MTPYEIDILMHYHCLAGDWEGPSKGNELYVETISNFINEGLLEKTGLNEPELRSTDRNQCYINGLSDVPLPVWTITKERS